MIVIIIIPNIHMKIQNVGKDVKKLDLSYTVGLNKKWSTTLENSLMFS
jgi:predicted patatin/cPLA2 family phospholipase